MERMAEEASLEAEEKEAKASEPKAPAPKRTSRKAAPKPKRMKFVWSVMDENGKEIASYPYPAKPDAEARAAELSTKTGKPHKVDAVRVPMEENE